MLGRAFGTLAALTIGANAFLLPPGIKSSSTSAFSNPNSQSVKLPCPDCVFPGQNEHAADAGDDDDVFWIQGRDRAVVLNFTLSDDTKAVNINGWQIYPVTMDNPTEPTVAEVAATTSFTDLQHHPEQATTLDVSAAGIFVDEEIVSDAGDKIVKVTYQVMSLQGQPISVDGAEVKLLQGADGSLMIISVEDVPKSHSIFDSDPLPPPPPPSEEGECSMLPAALCKWKSAVEAKIGGFKQGLPHKFGGKGCGGRKGPHKLPGHIRPHFDHFEGSVDEEGPAHAEKPDDEERPRHHHGHPHPHGPHGMHRGPHHDGHHRHHFLHKFVGASFSVLVPVIAGITMGMFVSLVGMAVGRLIAFLWIKFRRGGQRGYASVAQTDVETESMEKGDVVVVVAEEPLPRYEDAPAYEEKEQK